MHIRHLNYPGDVTSVIGFLPELYESNFPGFVAGAEFLNRKRAQLREAARDPGQIVLVAQDQTGVCGFIWMIVEVEYAGRRRGEISAIHVAKRVRGQGVGKLLMAEGELLLRGYGCDYVQLMVTTTNESATALYGQMGYEVTRYQMEKPLSRIADPRADKRDGRGKSGG